VRQGGWNSFGTAELNRTHHNYSIIFNLLSIHIWFIYDSYMIHIWFITTNDYMRFCLQLAAPRGLGYELHHPGCYCQEWLRKGNTSCIVLHSVAFVWFPSNDINRLRLLATCGHFGCFRPYRQLKSKPRSSMRLAIRARPMGMRHTGSLSGIFMNNFILAIFKLESEWKYAVLWAAPGSLMPLDCCHSPRHRG